MHHQCMLLMSDLFNQDIHTQPNSVATGCTVTGTQVLATRSH